MKLTRLLPWAVFVCAMAVALASLAPSGKTRGFDVERFGRLPVLEGGRVKPIDSVARNSLLLIRSQQSFRHEGRKVGANEWLLDVAFRPQVADQQPIFVINDPDVLGLIGLRQTANRYFSFSTLAPHLGELQRQAEAANAVDARQRTRFQSAMVNLFDRIHLYHRLRNTLQPVDSPAGLAGEIALRTDPAAPQRYRELAQSAYFRPLLPAPGGGRDTWRSVGEALAASVGGPVDPGLVAWARLGLAYSTQDTTLFDGAVEELRGITISSAPRALQHADREITFNRAQPFYMGMIVYVLALLAVFVSWLWIPRVLQPSAFALLLAGAIAHTAGLIARILIQGRPPVTNLYSSAVFVGWGAVILGIAVEWMYRRGFATAVAAASGFASLIVAHHLADGGDTMEMMRAVLDSNFWLATHVVTITIGYSGNFIAGAIAIGWAVRQQLVRRPDPATTRALSSTTYGVIAFALFFSFVGTVLGGIWADQSWGRFWGWDPKENGALLIVIWNAIILHARSGGHARERGVMAMAIFGNAITAFSWFGVNMLGVGLHSYGFMDRAFWALLAFVASQLAFMALCYAPPRFWSGKQGDVGGGETTPA